ncbi:MAG TPA: AMP-binding protein, partial [Trebonia sp.]|nr:AMP-binding protein [Trebonia sp.]
MTLFARPEIFSGLTGDGSPVLRSGQPLGDYPPTVVHSVRDWARRDPGYPMVAERAGPGTSGEAETVAAETGVSAGGWRTVSYGEAVRAADGIGQALLDLGLGPDRPLMIVSGNSVDHLLLTLGAMTAGISVAPGSVAYSLQSRDHQRIKDVRALITPGAVYAQDAGSFGPALDALASVPGLGPLPVIISRGRRDGALSVADLAATEPRGTVAPGAEPRSARPVTSVGSAFAAVTGSHVAKILFTSGSTGAPKGVLNTHRMLASNQQMMRQAWPFLAEERPVVVDWLPWSHTFGGNHNVNMVLTSGGTLYVDEGRPAPGLFGRSVANLADVRPTLYFNVPAGYAQLVPALEGDPAFARRFFSRLRLVFNAAAALPPGLRDRLAKLAAEYAPGRELPVTGSWGATETSPAVTTAHFSFTDARSIGVPLPGTEVKLAPAAEGTYEIRVKGPNVTPGYFGRPDLTAAAFDEEGFYRSGDAVALAVPARPIHGDSVQGDPVPVDPVPGNPDQGLVFLGRIAEDFKLATGTFVRVASARAALLSAVPLLSDAVIAGENRDYVTALAWLNPAETRDLAAESAGRVPSVGGDPAPGADSALIVHEKLRAVIAAALGRHNATAGSARRIARLVILARPASLDAGE